MDLFDRTETVEAVHNNLQEHQQSVEPSQEITSSLSLSLFLGCFLQYFISLFGLHTLTCATNTTSSTVPGLLLLLR